MREFIFRAWDGEDMHNEVHPVGNRVFDPNGGFWRDYKVVMQFTGLKDKNGKQVYEGDIIKSRNFYFEVRWINAAFHLVNRSEVRYGPRHYSLTPKNVKSMIVIGNIYENIKAK